MKLYTSLSSSLVMPSPVVVTIGNFDGVHLGHQSLFKRLRTLAGLEGNTVVISFSNHPSTLFSPTSPTPQLCTNIHKIELLKQEKIDHLFLLPFTESLSRQSAQEFLCSIQRVVPFTQLLLGYDATLGNKREGTPEKVRELAKQLNFHVEYLPALLSQGQPISSSRIRKLVQTRLFNEASELLGRPFSILSDCEMTSSSIDIECKNLCLPPNGNYQTILHSCNHSYPMIAKIEGNPLSSRLIFTSPSPCFPLEPHSLLEVIFIRSM